MYVKAINDEIIQYPYSLEDLKNEYPNTSFSSKISESTLSNYDVYPVVYEAAPSFDIYTEKVIVSETPILVGGKWTLTKSIVPLSEEQKEAKRLEREKRIKEECRRRILSVASETAQGNISQAGVIYTAMRINGVPDEQALAMAGFQQGDLSRAAAFQTWRGYMVDNIAKLGEETSIDYKNDSYWPPVPDGVEDLAKRF